MDGRYEKRGNVKGNQNKKKYIQIKKDTDEMRGTL